MGRPKIKIEFDVSDWIMEITGAFLLFLMIGFLLCHFNELPEVIPRHFNAAGEPDGFGQKSIIWSLPAIGLVMYIGIFFPEQVPVYFQLSKKYNRRKCRTSIPNSY